MVKMVLGSSDTQGQTMASVGEARITSYNEAISALSAFNSAGDLQGAAYDSGKQYGMNVITPLLKGAIMYTELLSEAVPKLPSKYRSEVGSEDLDSAVLESEIRSLEASLHSIRGMYNAMVGDESTSASTLSSLSNRMDDLLKQRNEKMDKLRKLNMFAGSSNEVFSVGEEGSLIDGLAQNLQTGLSQIQTEFASFGGTFSSHSNDMEWAKNIEGEWDKKAKIDEDYQKVLEKIKDGKELSEDDVKKINAYKSRYSNRELPENIQQKINSYNEKKKQELNKNNNKDKVSNPVSDILSKFSEYFDLGVSMVGEAGKWMSHTASSKLRPFITALQEGANGFVMYDSGSRSYRNAASEAAKLSKSGKFWTTIGKVVDNPLFKTAAFGIGMWDDMENKGKTFGQAFVHTGVSTATAYGGMLLFGSNPVGWAGVATVATGYMLYKGFEWAYDTNFLGLQDGLDWVGNRIDDGIKWTGEKVNDGLKWTGEKVNDGMKWVGERMDDVGQAFSDTVSFINPFD